MKKTEMEGTGTKTAREMTDSLIVFITPAAAPNLRQTFHHNKHVLLMCADLQLEFMYP